MSEQLDWYDGPGLVTPEELAELGGKYRADSLIVSYALGLENRAYEDGISSLEAREQLVVAGAVFEREVNAGGIHSFLFYYRAYLDTSKLSMCAIGRPELMKLIADADSVYLSDPDTSEALESFDDTYHSYELDMAEDLIRLATG